MNLAILFFILFIVAILWSLKDLKSPHNLYPKISRNVRKILSGVIELPKAR